MFSFIEFAAYAALESDEPCIDSKYYPIYNPTECEDAANRLGLVFGAEEEVSDYPGGCYVWTDSDPTDKTVFFNKNVTGALFVRQEESRPICGLGK